MSLKNKLVIALMSLAGLSSALAQELRPTFDPRESESDDPRYIVLPYAFYTEYLEASVGVGMIVQQAWQPQAVIGATAFGTSNGSNLQYFGAYYYRIPGLERWSFSLDGYHAYYKNAPYHLSVDSEGNPGNSHESNTDDFYLLESTESLIRLTADYVLPIGRGKKDGILALQTDNVEVSGFNPMKSGVTTVRIEPYQQVRDLGELNSLQRSSLSRGFRFELKYDNRDFYNEPRKGSNTELIYILGRSDEEERPNWHNWQVRHSQFIGLPKTRWGETTLALDAWLSDTPSWNNCGPTGLCARPPEFMGAFLGGPLRLRGYRTARYHGRSAVHYSGELRYTPAWQPNRTWNLPFGVDLPWWQLTAFADAGRVADEFSLDTLHNTMRYNVGAGARFKVEGVVARVEYAVAEDSSSLWVYLQHPF